MLGKIDYLCTVCCCEPEWAILRRGDVTCSWACADHLHTVCASLQRYDELTELIVKDFAKAVEWAQIEAQLDAIKDEPDGG